MQNYCSSTKASCTGLIVLTAQSVLIPWDQWGQWFHFRLGGHPLACLVPAWPKPAGKGLLSVHLIALCHSTRLLNFKYSIIVAVNNCLQKAWLWMDLEKVYSLQVFF